MAALVGHLTPVGNQLDFSRFFARQPEPDLEFTEEELDQTASTRPISPMKPPKKSGGGRPLLWIFLLLLVGGIGYVAMEPEQLTEWLAPLLGEAPQSSAPTVATQPHSPSQPSLAPPPPPPTAGEGTTAPAESQGAPTPSEPPLAPAQPTAPTPMPSAISPSSPLFAEGQRVTVVGNPAAPTEMISLTMDPTGTKPGAALRPGTTLTVADGDLQPSGWVYSVRSDDGTKGWISERRLRLKF
ncbi:hypothetical protein W02_41480 [Nitrospira sp. KM1]|uniref:hypothetical protein n=1 Tax=Nitrospira sp. KM1 TaxID=1936990 RepID=UPI0013A74B7A|nr:hypothetical protein [Nitrospira sp. KM1]BCA57008.1 hypothetical protein W02_41480 [Nitrospira sp. KM1]